MIPVVKRLLVWLIETASEVALLAMTFVIFYGPDQHGFAKDTWFFGSGIGVFAFTTGYLFTTAIGRAVWRGSRLWTYSVLASLLCSVHMWIFFSVANGWPLPERVRAWLAALCIVFACTVLGTYILRKWRAVGGAYGTAGASVMSMN